MLAFLGENPPVAIVAIAVNAASKKGRPKINKRTVSETVRIKYTVHNKRAVSLILGVICSLASEEDSKLYKLRPLILIAGSTTNARIMIPIPPIQCVRVRQTSRLIGRLSISFRIEAPVVVKPETDSNRAFIKPSKYQLK